MAATGRANSGMVRILVLAAVPLLVGGALFAQSLDHRTGVIFPAGATALEGLPQVRIDATRDNVTRRELDATEAAKSRLTINIVDGRFYWGDRTGKPLTMTTAGSFTYLSSTEPGRYVRIQRVNDTLSYVEHVDMAFGSVTYWGELRVVLKH